MKSKGFVQFFPSNQSIDGPYVRIRLLHVYLGLEDQGLLFESQGVHGPAVHDRLKRHSRKYQLVEKNSKWDFLT